MHGKARPEECDDVVPAWVGGVVVRLSLSADSTTCLVTAQKCNAKGAGFALACP